MSLNSSRASLGAITKQLAKEWQETKFHWNDSKAQEFEKKYIEELFSSVDTALAVIDQLDKVTTKIRKDCE